MMRLKGDMEAGYLTNKRLLSEKGEDMRAACIMESQFFEVVPKLKYDSRKELKEGLIESVILTLNQLGRKIENVGKEREKLMELDFETIKDEMRKL
jgi:hypothetical protein